MYSVISAALMVIGMVCILNLTPQQVTDDILSLLTPHDSVREKASAVRGNKKKHKLYHTLMNIRSALAATGKHKQFAVVCFASVAMFACGIVLAALIDNLFLMPVFSVAFALVPFFYITRTLSYYEKQTREELETTLSIITTSYVRSDDILAAVKENLTYIKPPLREVFQGFLGEATAVSSNIKRALYNLREKVDDDIFAEWCEVLIQCQDDRTLNDTLMPVVNKLTDVRIVNNELKTMMEAVRNEYWVMVALVIGNIPLLYVLNKDWFYTLVFATEGKAILGVCGVVILVTALLMLKFTKPISYKR